MEPGGTGQQAEVRQQRPGRQDRNHPAEQGRLVLRATPTSWPPPQSSPTRHRRTTNLIGQTLNGKRDARRLRFRHGRSALEDRDAGRARRAFRRPLHRRRTDKTRRGDVKDLPYVNGMNPEDAANKLPPMGFEAADRPGQVDSDETAGHRRLHRPPRRGRRPRGLHGHDLRLQRQQGHTARPNLDGTSPGGPRSRRGPAPQRGNQCPPWHPKSQTAAGRPLAPRTRPRPVDRPSNYRADGPRSSRRRRRCAAERAFRRRVGA